MGMEPPMLGVQRGGRQWGGDTKGGRQHSDPAGCPYPTPESSLQNRKVP